MAHKYDCNKYFHWYSWRYCLNRCYYWISVTQKEALSDPRHEKTIKVSVRPAKTQISLGIRPVWSASSLSAWRKLGSSAAHWVQSEDSDQTGRMPRLNWVFTGRTLILLVLSCRGSSYVSPRSEPCVCHGKYQWALWLWTLLWQWLTQDLLLVLPFNITAGLIAQTHCEKNDHQGKSALHHHYNAVYVFLWLFQMFINKYLSPP